MKNIQKIEFNSETNFILVFLMMAFLFLNNMAEAKTTVDNNISASSNSGGNIIKNGKIIEGKVKNDIEINTLINGKKIKPISFSQTDKDDVKVIEKKVNYVSKDGRIQINNSVKSEVGATNIIESDNLFEKKNLQISPIEVKESLLTKIKNSLTQYLTSIKSLFKVFTNNNRGN